MNMTDKHTGRRQENKSIDKQDKSSQSSHHNGWLLDSVYSLLLRKNTMSNTYRQLQFAYIPYQSTVNEAIDQR